MDTTKSSYMVTASLKQLHTNFVHNCLKKRISASLPETIARNILPATFAAEGLAQQH